MGGAQLIVALNVIAFAASIAMLIQAWRAHKSVSTRGSLAFLSCFILLSAGLLLRLIADVLVDYSSAYEAFLTGLTALGLQRGLLLLISALSILAGYTVLLLVVERIKNRSMWILTFFFVFLTVGLSSNIFLITHAVAAAILALLTRRYFHNYGKNKSRTLFIVLIAFSVLLLSHLCALFIPLGFIPHLAHLVLRIIGYFLLYAIAWRVTYGR